MKTLMTFKQEDGEGESIEMKIDRCGPVYIQRALYKFLLGCGLKDMEIFKFILVEEKNCEKKK